MNKLFESIWTYVTNNGVSEWHDADWHYIQPEGILTGSSRYDGKFLVRRTHEEIAELAPSLTDMVRQRRIPELKFLRSEARVPELFEGEVPPMFFYGRKKKDKERIGIALDELGLKDRVWVEDRRTALELE